MGRQARCRSIEQKLPHDPLLPSSLTTSLFIPFYVGDSSSQILVTPSTSLNNSSLFFSSLIASCTTSLLCSATCRPQPVFSFVVALRIQKILCSPTRLVLQLNASQLRCRHTSLSESPQFEAHHVVENFHRYPAVSAIAQH